MEGVVVIFTFKKIFNEVDFQNIFCLFARKGKPLGPLDKAMYPIDILEAFGVILW